MNLETLKPCTSLNASDRGKLGGLASAIARKEKKEMRIALETILSLTLSDDNIKTIEDISSLADIENVKLTVNEAIVLAQVKKALKGDTKSAEFIRDTIGQKPAQNINFENELPVIIMGENDLED